MFAVVISKAVILDLDDTLIVEEEVAHSSLRRAAELVAGRDPGQVVEVVLTTARRIWRAGPDHALCHQLGIASWEGLWATFEGSPSILDEVREWAPVYRQEAWRASLQELGIDDPALAAALSDRYVESQRAGHPLIDGAAELVHFLEGRCQLGLLSNGPADIQHHKLAGTGLADCFGAVDSWERDIIGALDAGLSAVWISAGRPQPEKRPNVTAVKAVGELVGRNF